jgi:hypothetical protein
MLELDSTIIMPTKPSRHAHATLLLYNATGKQQSAKCAFLICHVPAEATGSVIGGCRRISGVCRIACWVPHGTLHVVDARSGTLSTCVVVVEADGLENLHGQVDVEFDELSSDNRTDDQDEEDNEEEKVEDSVTDDAAFAELALLQRVDGRADLTTITS